MRVYVGVTAVLFALLAAAHVARLFAEGWHPLANPWFVATTLLALGMCAWAAALLGRRTPPPAPRA